MYKLIAVQLLHFSYNFINNIPSFRQKGENFIKSGLLKTCSNKIFTILNLNFQIIAIKIRFFSIFQAINVFFSIIINNR